MSSIYTYAQDTDLPYIKGIINRAHTDAPMFVTFFRYSIVFWPESVLRLMGNLVQYRRKLCTTEHTTICHCKNLLTIPITVHETGGFFAGLENVPDLVADLRGIRTYWGAQGINATVRK